jgi:hypothetical protein
MCHTAFWLLLRLIICCVCCCCCVQITYGINFYGPLYLTHLLIPLLQQTSHQSEGAGTPGHTRIVWTSSPVETLGETDWTDMK